MRNDAEDTVTVGNVDVAIGTQHETEQAALPAGIRHAGATELIKIRPAQDDVTDRAIVPDRHQQVVAIDRRVNS